MNVEKLKKSKEYNLVFTNGKKIKSRNFTLQYLNNKISKIRVGIIASKKIGNATQRNFVKRRIRSLIEKNFSETLIFTKDYVIVAKKGVLIEKFDSLYEELKVLLKKIENQYE